MFNRPGYMQVQAVPLNRAPVSQGPPFSKIFTREEKKKGTSLTANIKRKTKQKQPWVKQLNISFFFPGSLSSKYENVVWMWGIDQDRHPWRIPWRINQDQNEISNLGENRGETEVVPFFLFYWILFICKYIFGLWETLIQPRFRVLGKIRFFYWFCRLIQSLYIGMKLWIQWYIQIRSQEKLTTNLNLAWVYNSNFESIFINYMWKFVISGNCISNNDGEKIYSSSATLILL